MFLWICLITWLDGLCFGALTLYLFSRGWHLAGASVLFFGALFSFFSLSRILRRLRAFGFIL